MNTENAKPFVTTITKEQAEALKKLLIQQGFELTQPPYTLYSGKKTAVSCSVYTSLKLTVQGKGKREFIEFHLEPEILKATPFTHPTSTCDQTARIGIDEAGKGDFFGPLCVAGVYAEGPHIANLISMGVRDSKSISDKEIHILAAKIKKECPSHVITLNPSTYNELYTKFRNVNSLLAWGHATAIETLFKAFPCKKAIIDQFGHESLVRNAVLRKQIDIELIQRHKAEEDVVVAAASILARAAFLTGLEKLSIEVDMPLPKGATSVIKTGKILVQKWGKDILSKVSKSHFRTTEQVLGI